MQLTPTPPANAFVSEEFVNEEQKQYPIDVYLCNTCGHLQLLDVVDPDILFRGYVYVSSTSPVFVEHFRKYAEEILTFVKPSENAFAVDIGSNDGTLLRFFKDRCMRVLGIDPAYKIAQSATESGIETLPTYFTADLAQTIKKDRGSASIITANNVFAHIDDLIGVTKGIRELLSHDGIFVFEVSYLVDVIEKNLFDTIYHEHLSYHTIKPLKNFFHRYGMELIDTKRVPAHGGSLRGIVQHSDGPWTVSPSVNQLIELEDNLNLFRAEKFKAFIASINLVKKELTTLLRNLKAENKSIAGYGAPAKATTLLFHFDIGDVLDFIVDDSPWKQNLFTPGQHIPVFSADAIYERKPDYLLILAWNFAKPIIEKHRKYLDTGGHFIVPLPKVEII